MSKIVHTPQLCAKCKHQRSNGQRSRVRPKFGFGFGYGRNRTSVTGKKTGFSRSLQRRFDFYGTTYGDGTYHVEQSAICSVVNYLFLEHIQAEIRTSFLTLPVMNTICRSCGVFVGMAPSINVPTSSLTYLNHDINCEVAYCLQRQY